MAGRGLLSWPPQQNDEAESTLGIGDRLKALHFEPLTYCVIDLALDPVQGPGLALVDRPGHRESIYDAILPFLGVRGCPMLDRLTAAFVRKSRFVV